MLLRLAWKNIWRNKSRSLVVMGAVGIGLWVGAFIMAYIFGMIDQRLQDAVNHEISHLQIHHPLFDRDQEAKYFITEGPAVYSSVQAEPRIKAATARVVTFGMVASAKTSTGGKFIGILPSSENQVTDLAGKLTQGTYFDQGSRNKTIISERLAEKLNVRLRSKIVLTFQDTTGNIVAGAFRIIGLYQTHNSTYDQMNVFLNANDLLELLGAQNQYHEIAALLEDPDDLEVVVNDLEHLHAQSEVEGWNKLAPELGLMIESFDQYMVIFLIIILLALSFGIINTMLMAVLERVREIGMLLAIGMNRVRIFAMIFIETVLLVIIASPLGLLLAYVTIQYLAEAGMDLSWLYQEGYAAYGFQSYIYPQLEAIYYARIMIMVVITALLASIYPAITAVRLNPVTAIRKL